jgi:hypothetical protein
MSARTTSACLRPRRTSPARAASCVVARHPGPAHRVVHGLLDAGQRVRTTLLHSRVPVEAAASARRRRSRSSLARRPTPSSAELDAVGPRSCSRSTAWPARAWRLVFFAVVLLRAVERPALVDFLAASGSRPVVLRPLVEREGRTCATTWTCRNDDEQAVKMTPCSTSAAASSPISPLWRWPTRTLSQRGRARCRAQRARPSAAASPRSAAGNRG